MRPAICTRVAVRRRLRRGPSLGSLVPSSSSETAGESSSTSFGSGFPDSIRQPVQPGSSNFGTSASDARCSMRPSVCAPENSIGPRRSNCSIQPVAHPAELPQPVDSPTANRARRSANTTSPDRRIALGSRRSFRWLPRTSMPRSVALLGRGSGASSPSAISLMVWAFMLITSSGSNTSANSHGRPPSHVSGITTSGARRGSGCTMSRPVSQSMASWAGAACGLTAMRAMLRRSRASTAPVSLTATVPTSCAKSARSTVSSCSKSVSPACDGPSTIGRGRPLALPATSNCIRQGTSTAAWAEAEAPISSINTSAPAERRPSAIVSIRVRTAGSTRRRRSSRSVAQAGCREGPRLVVGVLTVTVVGAPRTGGREPMNRTGRIFSSSSPPASARSPRSSAGSSSLFASSAATISKVTGVWSLMLGKSSRRSTSRNTAASNAHGLPARPRLLVHRVSSVSPPLRPAESSSMTSCDSPASSVIVART